MLANVVMSLIMTLGSGDKGTSVNACSAQFNSVPIESTQGSSFISTLDSAITHYYDQLSSLKNVSQLAVDKVTASFDSTLYNQVFASLVDSFLLTTDKRLRVVAIDDAVSKKLDYAGYELIPAMELVTLQGKSVYVKGYTLAKIASKRRNSFFAENEMISYTLIELEHIRVPFFGTYSFESKALPAFSTDDNVYLSLEQMRNDGGILFDYFEKGFPVEKDPLLDAPWILQRKEYGEMYQQIKKKNFGNEKEKFIEQYFSKRKRAAIAHEESHLQRATERMRFGISFESLTPEQQLEELAIDEAKAVVREMNRGGSEFSALGLALQYMVVEGTEPYAFNAGLMVCSEAAWFILDNRNTFDTVDYSGLSGISDAVEQDMYIMSQFKNLTRPQIKLLGEQLEKKIDYK